MFLGYPYQENVVLFVITHPHISVAALRGKLNDPWNVVVARGHHQGALQDVKVQLDGRPLVLADPLEGCTEYKSPLYSATSFI